MKKEVDLREHVRQMLEQGRMTQILGESRRNGRPGWVTREQLHSDEAVREERIRSALPSRDKMLVIALDPDLGRYGAFEVVKPELELDFENGGSHAADPLHVAQNAASIHAESVHRAAVTAEAAMKQICSGSIKHYEELAAMIPADVDSAAVMSMLAQARKPRLALETLKGQVNLGGFDQMRKSLPCKVKLRSRLLTALNLLPSMVCV